MLLDRSVGHSVMYRPDLANEAVFVRACVCGCVVAHWCARLCVHTCLCACGVMYFRRVCVSV